VCPASLELNCIFRRGNSFEPDSAFLAFQHSSKDGTQPGRGDIFVRWGGSGPAVILIHGYAENSDSWAPPAADLMKDHTVKMYPVDNLEHP
jgi:hypothetical protein